MQKELIIQFVCFETTCDSMEFISQWDQYTKGMSDRKKIRLYQEVGTKRKSRYLSKHKCFDDEFKFNFRKERRSSHFPEAEMRVQQLGGYTIVQLQHDLDTNENKVFVFIHQPDIELEDYRQITGYRYLNIYKAYFENSVYEYILEFQADNNDEAELMAQLKSMGRHVELGMYKEYLLQDV
jgi:hypothetical protein